MKKAIVLILLVGLTACGTYKSIAPSQTDVERGAQKYPGLTLADLNQGKSIFEANCDNCHSLNRPFKVSIPALEKVMPEMADKANLDHKSAELVLEYLITMKSTTKK